MNKFHSSILFLILISGSVFLASCRNDENSTKKEVKETSIAVTRYENGAVKTEAQTKDGKAHGLVKHFTAGGVLESVYTYSDGRREGPAVVYFPNGQVREKKFYRQGLKEGKSSMFYRSGELFREAEYSQGKLNGLRKNYYKNGKLMSEEPFSQGFAGLGLKEFNMEGKSVESRPSIRISEENRLALEDKYILKLQLRPKQGSTTFYIGDLREGIYLNESSYPVETDSGVGEYLVYVKKGSFRMETLTISALYKSSRGNYGLVSRKYNLAVDNK